MHVQPYLFFDGRCEEAIGFYKKALGAEVEMLMHFKESPEPCRMPVPDDKVMHASVRIGNTTIMVSDGDCKGQTKFSGFSLSISVSTQDEAERLLHALGEGGHVQMPLTKTFFSPAFGMVADRFGVSWMVIAAE